MRKKRKNHSDNEQIQLIVNVAIRKTVNCNRVGTMNGNRGKTQFQIVRFESCVIRTHDPELLDHFGDLHNSCVAFFSVPY
jgi:hypothetical protein